ncbi:MAG: flagellar assembly protein FliX [Rickettsiaceae bacterium]
MIVIDPKTQSILPTNGTKNTSKNDKEVKFAPKKKLKGATKSENNATVSDVSGIIFLQEVDQYAEDQQNLEEFAQRAFKVLKELQLDLLQGRISHTRLHHLKDALNSSNFVINTPELANIVEQIQLRLDVEIAKIESN